RKTVVAESWVRTIGPWPLALGSKPLAASRAAMETVTAAGPELVSADNGETLRLMSCGGVVSAAAAAANKASAAAGPRSRGRRKMRPMQVRSCFFRLDLLTVLVAQADSLRLAFLLSPFSFRPLQATCAASHFEL